MISAIIIDDESHARKTLGKLLSIQFEQIIIIGEAANKRDAIRLIDEKQADLIFLDIDLPDGNGFDILKSIKAYPYQVIFVTAYQEFALQAIKFSALDYLLKPLNPKELEQAVNKCLKEKKNSFLKEQLKSFLSMVDQPLIKPQKLVLKTMDKIHVVEVAQIIRCEADNSYTSFYLENGERIMVSKGIKKYEELLVPMNFMRVHQSHLIQLDFISYYQKNSGGFLIMKDQTQIPVSNSKKSQLIHYLESMD